MFCLPDGFLLGASPGRKTQRAVQPPPIRGCQAIRIGRFGLLPGRSPLLGEYSLFLTLLRCFSSGGAPSRTMCSPWSVTPYRVTGCPIRTSSDLCSVAAPRCFSQLPTSFIGTQCQGIHRMPFFLLLLSPVVPNTTPAPPSRDGVTLAPLGCPDPSAASCPSRRGASQTSRSGSLVQELSRTQSPGGHRVRLCSCRRTRRVVSSVVKVHSPHLASRDGSGACAGSPPASFRVYRRTGRFTKRPCSSKPGERPLTRGRGYNV